MGLIFSRKKPEIGTKGFIVGNRFVGTLNDNSLLFKYIKFEVVKTRDNKESSGVQLSMFNMIKDEHIINWAGIVDVYADEGNDSPSAELPNKLFDNNANTKWFSWKFNKPSFVIAELSSPMLWTNNYCWYTANDLENRDPVSWNIYISSNGVSFSLVHSVVDYNTTTSRNALVGPFTN